MIDYLRFSKSGTEFIAGSQAHPHYFVYDMMIGNHLDGRKFFFISNPSGKSIKVPWRSRSGEHTSGKFEVSPDGRFVPVLSRAEELQLFSSGFWHSVVHTETFTLCPPKRRSC